jgi:hypothetical protein
MSNGGGLRWALDMEAINSASRRQVHVNHYRTPGVRLRPDASLAVYAGNDFIPTPLAAGGFHR